MVVVDFRIEPADPRWLRHDDPDGRMFDGGEYWISNALGGQTRPTIFLKIPEIIGSTNPKLTFTWETNDWYSVVVKKSKDDITYETIWGVGNHARTGGTPTIDLDPECQYYSFHFADGDLEFEWTRLYKSATLEYEPPKRPSLLWLLPFLGFAGLIYWSIRKERA